MGYFKHYSGTSEQRASEERPDTLQRPKSLERISTPINTMCVVASKERPPPSSEQGPH